MNDLWETSPEQEWESVVSRNRTELAGAYFSTAKELRHMAESCGFNFVPVEVIAVDDRTAHLVLAPKGVGELHVHANRDRHWYAFQIREIEHAVAT
jgi:mannose-6-phosphate isomerase-like protein (cupin superfamily)